MYDLTNICFTCLKDKQNLQAVYLNNADDFTTKQIKYVLPEIMQLEEEIPAYICLKCKIELNSFYIFKKRWLENYFRLKQCTKQLKRSNDIYDEINIKQEQETPKMQQGQTVFLNNEETMDIKEPILSDIKTENVSDSEFSVSGNANEMDQNETFCNEYQKDNIEFVSCEDYTEISDIKKENYDENIADAAHKLDHRNESVCNYNLFKKSEFVVINTNVSPSLNENVNVGIKHVPNSFECTICNKKLTSKYNLKTHIKTHAGIRNFKCTICDKKFTQSSSLNVHMKIHEGVKKFECIKCKKSFLRQPCLNQHMKLHSGIKNFACSICNKKFAQNKNLKTHYKIHAGVKDFKCFICNQSFTQNSHLTIHMKIHAGIKEFKCLICKKSFSEQSNLTRHLKIHEKLLICNKQFSKQSQMKQHMSKHNEQINENSGNDELKY